MKDLREVVASHPQRYPESCSSWAVEVALLTFGHESPPDLQTRFPNGFSNEVIDLLKSNFGISSYQKAFGDDFTKFANETIDAFNQGFLPILILPSYISYSREDQGLKVSFHAYVAVEENESLGFITRSFDPPKADFYTVQEIAKMHLEWSGHLQRGKFQVGPLLHTLFARPLNWDEQTA